jgi:hypothetical protein
MRRRKRGICELIESTTGLDEKSFLQHSSQIDAGDSDRIYVTSSSDSFRAKNGEGSVFQT